MHHLLTSQKYAMPSRIVAILALFIALTFANAAFSQADFSAVIQRISKSVVVIKGNNGQGSGFIVSPDGKIATNLHVIRGMDQGAVQLSDGEIFDTFTVIGVDPRRDLAIIKIAGFNLPAVDLGDSDAIKIGEPVAVVGSPRGLSGTITTGVLSAIRPIDGTKLLQTDAAVNPGNSGGPLIKLDGTVVGIVVAKVVNAENLNFAIPINFLRGILGNLTPPMTLAQFSESLKGQTDIFGLGPEDFAGSIEDVVRKLASTIVLHGKAGTKVRGVSLQDYLKGRNTETECLNGLIAAKGKQVKVPTPANEAIVQIDRQIRLGALKPDRSNLAHVQKIIDRSEGKK